MDENGLLEDNKGLVYSQLHRFAMVGDTEAESIAYEALLIAVRTYEDGKSKLSTYATVCIYNALCNYARSKAREPEIISSNTVIHTERTTDAREVTLQDTFEDERRTDDNILREELYAQLHAAYDSCYKRLTNPKHIAIVDAWQQSEYSASTRDISKQVGVSQPYASEVLINFKARLKKKMEAYYVHSRNCT